MLNTFSPHLIRNLTSVRSLHSTLAAADQFIRSVTANVPSETYFFKSAVQFTMTLICWRWGVSGNEGTRKRLPLRADV